MIDYMVIDRSYQGEYVRFQTEEEAREYVKNVSDYSPDIQPGDFVIFKREKIAVI